MRGGCRRDGCRLVSRRLPSTWETPTPARHPLRKNMSSTSSDELTTWLSGLKRGDSRAIEQIWQEYFDKLLRLIKGRLGNSPLRVADEEDIALSALNSFYGGVQA